VAVPDGLAARVDEALREDPAKPWDEVIADIARHHHESDDK
jgi:hypothetical protein